MDSMLEKFGIYDVMGIWGAGALTVTYFMFTCWDYAVYILTMLGITSPIQNELYMLIIMYTAVSYFVGVVLQEIGKIIADHSSKFKFETADTFLKESATVSGRGLGKKIYDDYSKIVRNVIPEPDRDGLTFDKANSYIKYSAKIGTKRIDKFHSAYALSRSLSLCFWGHGILQVTLRILFCIPFWPFLFFLIIDLFFGILFLERAYRYFLSWIRDVFIQYHVTIHNP